MNLLINVVLLGLIVVILSVFSVTLFVTVRNAFLRYEEIPVAVKVIDKHYTSAHTTTTFFREGKVTVPQVHYHPKEYCVHVEWRNKVYTINDEKLYKKVAIGEWTIVRAHIGYNKKNIEKHTYLTA